MNKIVYQLVAATRINLKNIPRRLGSSLSTAFSIALTSGVLMAFLALSNGFQRTVGESGARDVAIVSGTGSTSEINSRISPEQLQLLDTAPGIARHESAPVVSPELYVMVNVFKKGEGAKVSVPLRGMTSFGPLVRTKYRLVSGRTIRPGTSEIVVSAGFAREFVGFEIGKEIVLRNSVWTVVGTFDLQGSVYESEIWADLTTVQGRFNRQNVVQTARILLRDPGALGELQTFVNEDPRLQLDVKSEAFYFSRQAQDTRYYIQYLSWPLAITMALGALMGALNTMYNSVAARAAEIATLRALGFHRVSIFVSTLVESLVLAVGGAGVGMVATYLIFDGLTSSTVGAGFQQIVFRFRLDADAMVSGALLSLAIGLLGGLLPAYRSSRQSFLALAQSD